MKKERAREIISEGIVIGIHYVPLSYIETPVFGSIRKGNLHQNFHNCAKYTQKK